jgi:APA family basic amino acid/polyamine antiporter
LLSAEVGRSLAAAGDLPHLFRRTNAAGAPTGSILVGAGVATLLVLASSTESFVEVYKFIALVSTVAALILYAMCAAAALKLKTMGRWAIVALLALVYAIAMFFGAGLEATLWGLGLAIVGLPIRFLSRRFSSSATTLPAEPARGAPPE